MNLLQIFNIFIFFLFTSFFSITSIFTILLISKELSYKPNYNCNCDNVFPLYIKLDNDNNVKFDINKYNTPIKNNKLNIINTSEDGDNHKIIANPYDYNQICYQNESNKSSI